MRLISLLIALILFVAPLGADAYQDAFNKPQPKLRAVQLNYQNTIVFSTEVDRLTVSVFIAALVGKRIMLPPNETLYVVIASGGGEYPSGLQLLEAIHNIPNTQIICKYCASAAGMLFATSGLPRLVTTKSVVLMHEMFMDHITAEMMNNPNYQVELKTASDDFNQRMYSVIGMSKEDYEKKNP